jgi:hypothetical protein
MPDQLTRADLASSMRNIEIDVNACRKRAAGGPVRVSFRVASNGSVRNLQIEAPEGAVHCIRRTLKSASFPETRRGGGPFTYELK